jgi:hypothetical protein
LVETGFPNFAELLNPFVNFFHFVNFELVINFSAFVFLFYQFTLRQNAQVFRNCLPGSVEMFGKVMIALLVGSAIA